MRLVLTIMAAAVLALAAPAAAASVDDAPVVRPDASRDWGNHEACTTDGETTQCFASEQAMDLHLGFSTLANCSSSLRLYAGASYATPVLHISARGRWLNLGDYGFNNRTSSYRVGACSSIFADGRNGIGSWYPGSTVAYAQASRMLTGWDNRVSSVYVY